MNIIYKNFKTQLLLAIVLFGASMGFAQNATVSVPVGYTVVVAGVGGTLGANPTGKVGQGGVVSMIDALAASPFTTNQGGTFTFTGPAGITLGPVTTWALSGDLSNTTPAGTLPGISGNYNGQTQPPNGASAIIKSYNKSFRPSEALAPSNASWARSKGRVTVGYTTNQLLCPGVFIGSSLSFEVFKVFPANAILPTQPTNIPKIVGPNCIVANQPVTYSVDQVASDNAGDGIGFDSYYWSGIPASLSGSLYYSADNSSVTFTPSANTTFTIKCCLGKMNANVIPSGPGPNEVILPVTTYSACVNKAVGGVPSAPSVNCVAVPASLTALSVSQGTNCLPTGTTSFTVTIPAISLITGYTYVWSSSNTSWSLLQSGTQNSVLAITTLDNNPSTLTLTVTNGSCVPTTFTYVVNRTLTPALAITGLLGVAPTTCLGNPASFSLPQNALGSLTNWTIDTVPTGGALPAGAPTVATGTGSGATCVVTPGTRAGQYTLVATAKAATGCTTTNTSIVINIQAPKPTFTASFPSCVPLGSPVALTTIAVTPIPGATNYTWTLPVGWSCSSGCTTANPSLFAANTSTVGAAALAAQSLSVVANVGTSCPSDLATSALINYIRLTSNTLQSGSGNCDQYSVNTGAPCLATGNPIASFTVGGVPAVSNGSTVSVFGNTLSLCGNTAPGNGTVCANVVVGGITYTTCSSTNATGSHGLRQANTISSSIKEVIEGVIISPNPSSGNFTIAVAAIKEDTAQAMLFDFNGNEIATYTLHQGENKILKEGLTKGTYLVVLKIDGKQEARQLIIK